MMLHIPIRHWELCEDLDAIPKENLISKRHPSDPPKYKTTRLLMRIQHTAIPPKRLMNFVGLPQHIIISTAYVAHISRGRSVAG